MDFLETISHPIKNFEWYFPESVKAKFPKRYRTKDERKKCVDTIFLYDEDGDVMGDTIVFSGFPVVYSLTPQKSQHEDHPDHKFFFCFERAYLDAEDDFKWKTLYIFSSCPSFEIFQEIYSKDMYHNIDKYGNVMNYRCFYETLRGPRRVCFDLDHDQILVAYPEKSIPEIIEAFESDFNAYIREISTENVHHSFYIKSASNPTKTSLHFVSADIVLQDETEMKLMYKGFLSWYAKHEKKVPFDKSISSSNRAFRMIYSSKRCDPTPKKRRPFLPIDKDGNVLPFETADGVHFLLPHERRRLEAWYYATYIPEGMAPFLNDEIRGRINTLTGKNKPERDRRPRKETDRRSGYTERSFEVKREDEEYIELDFDDQKLLDSLKLLEECVKKPEWQSDMLKEYIKNGESKDGSGPFCYDDWKNVAFAVWNCMSDRNGLKQKRWDMIYPFVWPFYRHHHQKDPRSSFGAHGVMSKKDGGISYGTLLKLISKHPKYQNMKHTLIFPKYTSDLTINQKVMVDYDEILENHDTLIVKSNMGTHKTQKEYQYIKTHCKDKNVCIVNFRVSLAKQYQNVFDKMYSEGELDYPFESYNDIDQKEMIDADDHPYVLVQINSLWRLRGEYDVFIIDECESVFETLITMEGMNKKKVMESLMVYLRTSKKVIMMDANCTNLPRGLAEYAERKEIYAIDNTWQSMSNIQADIVASEEDFLEKLFTDIKAGKKIVVCSNTRTFCEAFEREALRQYPDTKMLIVTGRSEQKVKDYVPDVEWVKYDIVVYSPTITAGVSMTVKHFDKRYCYFVSNSCSALMASQMVFRVRNTKESGMNIYIKQMRTESFLPMTEKEILADIDLKKNTYLEYGIQFNCATKTFVKNEYHKMYVCVTHLLNMSQNFFQDCLIHYLNNHGVLVHIQNIEEVKCEYAFVQGKKKGQVCGMKCPKENRKARDLKLCTAHYSQAMKKKNKPRKEMKDDNIPDSQEAKYDAYGANPDKEETQYKKGMALQKQILKMEEIQRMYDSRDVDDIRPYIDEQKKHKLDEKKKKENDLIISRYKFRKNTRFTVDHEREENTFNAYTAWMILENQKREKKKEKEEPLDIQSINTDMIRMSAMTDMYAIQKTMSGYLSMNGEGFIDVENDIEAENNKYNVFVQERMCLDILNVMGFKHKYDLNHFIKENDFPYEKILEYFTPTTVKRIGKFFNRGGKVGGTINEIYEEYIMKKEKGEFVEFSPDDKEAISKFLNTFMLKKYMGVSVSKKGTRKFTLCGESLDMCFKYALGPYDEYYEEKQVERMCERLKERPIKSEPREEE